MNERLTLNAEALKDVAQKDNAAAFLTWGTYGPNGDQPLTHKSLADLDTEHLENIIISQPHVLPHFKAAILCELKKRYQNV